VLPGAELLAHVRLTGGGRNVTVPMDARGQVLIPFRGAGGAGGGSFRYVSAVDVVTGKLPAGDLAGKLVLIGTTAAGLLDLRVTPLGATYPGVELHANLLSGLLDGHLPVKPDYALGYEIVMLLFSGLVLLFWLPRLRPSRSIVLCLVVLAVVVGCNFALYAFEGLVLPLAANVSMVLIAFALSMSYGYFFESRSRENLATLFGTYVPPELVGGMVGESGEYPMQAAHQELTVMFCDMRGFTKLSEQLQPLQLQALLNDVFTRLSREIRSHEGTIDKFMGDCVMAFWGAPVATPDHANLAVASALQMIEAVKVWNLHQSFSNAQSIQVGIGINTGQMFVGDMGSDIRRSYTVIGDAVNLAARLEGLSGVYGVDLVVGEGTRQKANRFVWQELDRVRVKGKGIAVDVFSVVAKADQLTARQASELTSWNAFLNAYRKQDWPTSEMLLQGLQTQNPTKQLYQLYAERVASRKLLPFDPTWDGAASFETK
jgi:adenylate cyclase